MEEARAADHQREVVVERERELQASNTALEQQIEVRRVALSAPLGKASPDEAESQKCEEGLALDVVERSLELEGLEVREHQAATNEDVVATREARV